MHDLDSAYETRWYASYVSDSCWIGEDIPTYHAMHLDALQLSSFLANISFPFLIRTLTVPRGSQAPG